MYALSSCCLQPMFSVNLPMLVYLRRVLLISCGFLGAAYLLSILNIYNDPITPFRAFFTAITFWTRFSPSCLVK